MTTSNPRHKNLTARHSFPYSISATDAYYSFCLLKTWSPGEKQLQCVGYMLPSVVHAMPWTSNFAVHHDARLVTIPYFPGSESAALAAQLDHARATDAFRVLRGWRDELYPIAGLARAVTMERAGSSLFGIATFGVHMTAFARAPSAPGGGGGELRIWVPRRAAAKTYGGMLDNSVAGGIAAGEDPFESLVREAAEEASLPAALVRRQARPVGTISYFHVRDARAGGETGLLQPETQYVYDLEVGEDVLLRPSDDEVQEFQLWGCGEVKRALKEGQFKPNCALCLIDFLVRHGEIGAQTEPDYLKILPRMHRRVHFEERRLED